MPENYLDVDKRTDRYKHLGLFFTSQRSGHAQTLHFNFL